MAYKRELIAQTKNLFNYSGKLKQYVDTANCTIVETLTNGAILQGNIGSEPGNASYDNGWFRPGNDSGYGTAVTLSANDIVTISADYEILERNYASPTPIGVYLYGTESLANQWSQIETGVLYRIKATYTIAKDGQYYPVFTLNSSKVKITNIQIEKNSTATDYVPYGHLSSYKKLLKVSDICQLLDKKTYEPTHTTSGVVYTNNGDGTITVNSLNITANTYDNIAPTIFAKKGHKYCVPLYGNYHGGYFYIQVNNEKDNYVAEISNGIYEVSVDNYRLVPRIVAYLDSPIDDKVYKPQLFDLTEMYGAGNEPSTVAEFKAKFPNELYDYSPRCWVKSYKTGLIAETKNLLSEIKPNINTKVENGVVYQVIADTREFDNLKLQLANDDVVVASWHGGNPQMGKNTLTFTTAVLPTHNGIKFGLNGLARDTIVAVPITLENNTTYTLSMDFINITQGEIAWTNSMLEKGTTATDYVPYGYL